ncbi:hypothetical protein IWX49DRAFT_580282 [Phyllosticta citricarpa]|uniref:Uncharacterized protein n=1 Tax=Phyllosticta citricarpa TaxID=55181 RepID=A0ABR1LNE1_9PEZI
MRPGAWMADGGGEKEKRLASPVRVSSKHDTLFFFFDGLYRPAAATGSLGYVGWVGVCAARPRKQTTITTLRPDRRTTTTSRRRQARWRNYRIGTIALVGAKRADHCAGPRSHRRVWTHREARDGSRSIDGDHGDVMTPEPCSPWLQQQQQQQQHWHVGKQRKRRRFGRKPCRGGGGGDGDGDGVVSWSAVALGNIHRIQQAGTGTECNAIVAT